MSRLIIAILTLIFLSSCSEERIYKKQYEDRRIQLDWYYTQNLLQRSSDIIEIECVGSKAYKSSVRFEVPEKWLSDIIITEKNILITYEKVRFEIIDLIIKTDSVCGIDVVLSEATE